MVHLSSYWDPTGCLVSDTDGGLSLVFAIGP